MAWDRDRLKLLNTLTCLAHCIRIFSDSPSGPDALSVRPYFCTWCIHTVKSRRSSWYCLCLRFLIISDYTVCSTKTVHHSSHYHVLIRTNKLITALLKGEICLLPHVPERSMCSPEWWLEWNPASTLSLCVYNWIGTVMLSAVSQMLWKCQFFWEHKCLHLDLIRPKKIEESKLLFYLCLCQEI